MDEENLPSPRKHTSRLCKSSTLYEPKDENTGTKTAQLNGISKSNSLDIPEKTMIVTSINGKFSDHSLSFKETIVRKLQD